MPNSARDVYGSTPRAKAKRRAPEPPPVSIHGPRDSGVQADANRVRTPPRSTTAFGPVRRADRTVTRAQRAAHRRTNRVDRRLPPFPTPTVPVLRHPTRKQTATANRLVHESFARNLGRAVSGQGAASNDRAKFLAQSLRTHPGTRRLTRVNAAVARRNTRDALATLGRFYGARTRQEAIRVGRQVTARKVARDGRLRSGVTSPFDRGPTALQSLLGGGPGVVLAEALDTTAKRAASDVKAIAEFPFVGGYEALEATLEAGRGLPGVREVIDLPTHLPLVGGSLRGTVIPTTSGLGRAKRLGEGVLKGLDQSVPGQLLLHGDPEGALKSFQEHPVFAALDLGAASSVVGRGAGAVTRALGSTAEEAGVRGALARAGSTFRLPVGLNTDGGLAVAQRTASKDMLHATSQRSVDAQREFLRDSSGKVVTVHDPRRRKPVPVLKALPGEERLLKTRRSDFEAARANAVERYSREATGRDVAKADRGGRVRGRIGRKAQNAVSMAIEGTLRRDHPESGTTFKADVRKRIEKLEHQISQAHVPTRRGPGYRSTKGIRQAREELAALRKLEALSPEQVDRLFAAKDKIGRLRVAQDAERARLGIEPAAQLERARLGPYAMSHMDARHFTVEEHAQLERQARQVERQARAKVDALPKGPARAQALAEWRRARDHRIEVSGRHPNGVRVHENAARQATRAETAHKRVLEEVEKTLRRRRELVGAQRVRRGVKADANVAKGAKELARIDARLKQLTVKAKAAKKAAADARRAADAARLPNAEAALRTAEGKFLSNDAIKTHMREHGVDPGTIGQLSHKELGNRAFHKRFDVSSRSSGGGPRRTGSAFQRGESGFGPKQVEKSAANAATTIAKAQQVDRFIQDNALKHPAAAKVAQGGKLTADERKIVQRGGGFTAKEALELAKRLEDDSGGKRQYVAVRMHGAKLDAETRAAVGKLQHSRAFDELSSKLLNDRVVKEADSTSARNVALVDAQQFNRLARHMAASGELEKLIQMLNRPFRFSVLAQPRWLTGNFVEPYFVRLPASGSGIINVPGMAMDIARSIKTLRSMERSGDPAVRAAAQEIRAQQLGGLFLGGRGASNRRVTRDFAPKPGAGPVEAAAGKVIQGGAFIRNMPVVKQLADLAGIPPGAYFKANRLLIEQWAQHASLGRSIRKDLEELYGSWTKAWSLSDAAIKDARRGLMNTATQERFMRAQHELLGKYEGFSPSVRRMVQTIMPFAPWAMSAARFTFWTMPAHHTILTSLLSKSANVYAQSWADEHKDAPPGGLQLAVRTKDGGFVDLARYTPYGFSGPVVEGDIQPITDQIMPQLSGVSAALGGHDPFNRDLRVKPTESNSQGIPSTGDKVKIALYSLLEATGGPYWSLARRLQEGGGTAYADSTVFSPKTKPGSSHMSAVRRTLDPFRPTYLKAPSSASSDSGLPPGLQKALERRAGKASSSIPPGLQKALERRALAGG